MGKALKTAGVIIGAAALIATGVGAMAMPGLAGSTTLFGISTGTLNTISSGLIAVGGMLDKPKSQGSAQPDEWTSNPDQPIPFLFGRMGVAGKIVQRDEFGPDNMYQGIVGIISGAGPIKGIQSFKGDDQAVTFGANGIAVSSQWQGEMWMVRRSGAQPDTVLTVPAGLKSGGQSFEWSSSAKLSGKACYLQVLGENSKGSAYPAGIPDPVHVGEGIYGYDPRYDSTYPGGDGPCRLGVRSTYRYIEDPIIGGLNWALGMVENGQVVGGVGASVDGIDIPAFVEAANISEANGWKVAAWPDTSEDVSSVLDQFLQAGGAVRARHAGKISCVSRGAPRASVVTVTARDLAGSIELNTAPSLFDQLNTITPRFMSEAGGWKLTPANPVAFAAYVTEDGGKHGDQIDYRFCPLLKQAAELAAYDILDAREPFSGSVPLKPHMRLLKRGDCFVIDEPGILLDGVKCIVLSRSYDPKTAQVRIGFRSETDSKHALALGKTTTLPDFPVLTPTDPTFVSPPEAGDWTITPRPPAPGGGQLPSFDLGGIVSNDTATSIIVEHGPTDEGPWKQAYEGPPTVTNIPLDGLQSGAIYYIAIQYRRDNNYSERQVYGPYTAPILDPGPNAPTILQQRADIDALADLQASETVIRQEQVDALIKRSIDVPNMVPNSTAAVDLRLWYPSAWTRGFDPAQGSFFFCSAAGDHFNVSENIPASVGQTYTLSFNSDTGGGVGAVYAAAYNGTTLIQDGLGFLAYTSTDWGIRRKCPSFVLPAGATSYRVVTQKTSSAPYNGVKMIMGNLGEARDWRDDATDRIIQGEVSITKTVVLDLESQNALARLSLVAAASGGVPARIGLTSSTLGSAITFDAPYIYWGANTVFEDSSDTLVTVVGDRVRVLAFGAPFGAGNDLLEWWGPASVALGSMNTVNGLQGRMTTAPYVFDNTVTAPFLASASPSNSGRVVTTPGTYASTVVTVNVTGGSGLYEYQWGYFAGSTGATATSPTGASTQINQTVATDETKSVVFLCFVQDTVTGKTTSTTYRYTLTHSA